MIKRFCKVVMLEALIVLSLCTCTFPANTAYAETPNVNEAFIEGVIIGTDKFAESVKEKMTEIVRSYEKEQQALEQQQAEEEQQAVEEFVEEEEAFYWDGEVITASSGVANGPSGFETYYNLPMGGVIDIMRGLGYDEANYPYWVRDDGCKMLGDYIMVAANLDIRPYGTILPCSRGMAIVCDTGTFAQSNPYQLDIAVSW